MPAKRLPTRRNHETFETTFGPYDLRVGVGRFADGRPAEVFLHAAKDGTQVDAMVRETAILLSLLLRHGCRIATIAADLPVGDDGEPIGLVGHLMQVIG